MNTNIFERITEIAENKGFRSINDFALNGLGSKSSEKINRLKDPKKKPSYEIVNDISNKFEDVDVRWLVTGDEKKHNNKVVEPTEIYYTKNTLKTANNQIPLFDIDAIAGFTPIFTDLNTLKPIDFLHIPNSPESDGALYASGDSMHPIIKSRDILCFKLIKDIKNDIFWGKTYILDLALSDDDLLTTKYINRGKDDNHILLVSENKHYQDKQIHISKIRGLAIVKMVVKMS